MIYSKPRTCGDDLPCKVLVHFQVGLNINIDTAYPPSFAFCFKRHQLPGSWKLQVVISSEVLMYSL